MLNRVAKLETSKVSPILAMFGGEEGWAAYEAEIEAGLAQGLYDRLDMLVVMASLRRWMTLYPV